MMKVYTDQVYAPHICGCKTNRNTIMGYCASPGKPIVQFKVRKIVWIFCFLCSHEFGCTLFMHAFKKMLSQNIICIYSVAFQCYW